jgi:glycosyltransferase involved in cell wall biosynthesis
MKKISFIIPAFNEEGNILELHNQINQSTKDYENYDFEFLFIENGSTDQTFFRILDLVKKDSRVKYLKLSRNFKMDGGIAAGLDYVTGDAAIIMTANLQDDPKIIPDFISKWEEGFNHVYGIVKSRPGKSLIRRLNSIIFYKLINKMTNNLVPIGVSDYRLVDRKVIESVKTLKEYNRFYRGFFSWVGFKSIGIEFNRQKRFSGSSHASTFPVLGFAIRAMLAFSTKPLKISVFITLITSSISLAILVQQTLKWFRFGVPFDGFGTLTGILLLFISFLFMILSIIGEYIGLIYDETKQRPHYIVEEKSNI